MAKNTGMITWIIIAVIAIIMILGYVLYNQMQNPTSIPTPKTNTPSSSGTHNIEISNFAFSTASLIIKPGDTVIWTNKDSSPHTVTSDTGTELSSKLLKTNEVYSHTFNTAGTFNYHCEVHPSMKASITAK